MKKISLDNLKLGMYIGKNILDEKNNVVVEKNTVVTLEIIEKLENFGILYVEVMEPKEIEAVSGKKEKKADIENAVSTPAPKPGKKEKTKKIGKILPGNNKISKSIFEEKNQETFVKFKANMDKETAIITNGFSKLLQSTPRHNNLSTFDVLAKALFESNKTSLNLLDMIYKMHEMSDVVYTHCLNVSMIAGQFGRWLGMSDGDIQILIHCGLFHDIGKLMVPEEILNKPSALTPEEYKIMQTHVTKGYEFLNKFNNIDPKVKKAVLLHHERCDGSGYPMQLTGDKIDKYSKIIAIADTYEAMTSTRLYRKSICPFKVAEEFEKEGLHKFDTKYILKFLDRMVTTYLQRKVLLNNGEVATVAMINRNVKSRPLVQLEDGEFIDLAKHQEFSIEELVD